MKAPKGLTEHVCMSRLQHRLFSGLTVTVFENVTTLEIDRQACFDKREQCGFLRYRYFR